MNYPARTRKLLHLPLSRLWAGESVRDVRLEHLTERDGGLVCAAGLTPLEKDYPDGITAVYAVADEVFLYFPLEGDPDGYGALYGLNCKQNWFYHKLGKVYDITMFQPAIKHHTWYVLAENGIYFFRDYNPPILAERNVYANHCATYSERVFAVSKTRIMHCAAMENTLWSPSILHKPEYYGEIDLPLYHGEYVGCAAFNGRFYVFCREGILGLRMGGETLAARIEDIPYDGGVIVEGSVVCCGETAVFFTNRGLISFDGNKCRRLFAPGAERLDLGSPFTASHAGGIYYFHGRLKDGSPVLYAYDLDRGRESFLHIDADGFSACIDAYALKDGTLYRLTERGLPADGSGCSLVFTLLAGTRENACTEWVRIEGEGKFEVTAKDCFGRVARAFGEAGKRLPFTRDLGGELLVTVNSHDESLRITGVTFGIGEDERYED